jgi:trehalose 6-phosphate phosphatase
MHKFRAATGAGVRVQKTEQGAMGAVRPLWSAADNLKQRVAEADALYGFFSFETALSQRASHGHLRTSPASRAALIRLCAAPETRAAVVSARPVEVLQRRLRLHRLGYVGVHGAEVRAFGLRAVTEPNLEQAEAAIQKLRRACSRVDALRANGVTLDDRVWSLALQLRNAEPPVRAAAAEEFGKLAHGVGLTLRQGTPDCLEAVPEGTHVWRAVLGLLAGMRGALPVYVGAGEADEQAFQILNRRSAITVRVGAAPRGGTHARWQVADSGEVIRLIHWLADARRKT